VKKNHEQIVPNDYSVRSIEELEKLALLGEQIASIAHELNNPLSAILGYSEILQSIELEPKAKRYANNIYISAIRAAKISEGILTYLKKKETKLISLNINEVIEKTLSLFEYQAKLHQISIKLDLSSVPSVRGDFHKLQQVFFNLIMNAIQSLETWKGEKKILLSSKLTENKIRIMISDSGPGIDNSNIRQIFSPFHTTKKNGTGLGLSIVHSIVKEHGGDILLMPNAIGCSFMIDFPVSIETKQHNIPVAENKIVENKKVLIIDDDEIVINAIGGIIKLLGCTVTFTTNAFDALDELRKSNFDIILVDYKMPEMNGVDFINTASKFIDIKKFVLMTGYIGLDAREIREKYKIPVLQKPIGLEELKLALSGSIL